MPLTLFKLNFVPGQPTATGHVYDRDEFLKILGDKIDEGLLVFASVDDIIQRQAEKAIGIARSYLIARDDSIHVEVSLNVLTAEILNRLEYAPEITTYGLGEVEGERNAVSNFELHGLLIQIPLYSPIIEKG